VRGFREIAARIVGEPRVWPLSVSAVSYPGACGGSQLAHLTLPLATTAETDNGQTSASPTILAAISRSTHSNRLDEVFAWDANGNTQAAGSA